MSGDAADWMGKINTGLPIGFNQNRKEDNELIEKKKVGRPEKDTSLVTQHSFELLDAIPGRTVLIDGPGRREKIKKITIPIPEELHSELKPVGVSPAIIGLAMYAIEQLKKDGKTLAITHIKK